MDLWNSLDILWLLHIEIGANKTKKKWFSAPETKGVWVFHAFCTWWSCEELATHPSAAKKISSKKQWKTYLTSKFLKHPKPRQKLNQSRCSLYRFETTFFPLSPAPPGARPAKLPCDLLRHRWQKICASVKKSWEAWAPKSWKETTTNQDRPLKKLELNVLKLRFVITCIHDI